ncbi:FAD-binding oxidoreductase [Mesorhizobium sp. LHD-90]|uniref:NAD(P)/FAD-dependent oxidoreductase n=1 Tax=Mesorhizobium sp. LHD-90 TaxID=3071414 RepID=UPI0027E0AC20|nr:FAD-binding oxidoreductase [Mesorhizobium sp. LHD-90]MDQ6433211.1 FAD-binding oxidoreductase [Mesorhizobium sp. LHD-90]
MSVLSSQFKPTSYWWEAAPPIDGTRAAPDGNYDVAVVGSGVIGLNAALALAEGGRKVVVFDSGKIGSGASTRNNGSIVPFHFLHQEQLEARFGAEVGARVARMFVDAFEHLLKVPKRYGFDPMIKPYERFFLACSPKHYAHYVADAALEGERGLGLGWKPIDKAELERRTGVRGYHGGLHIPNSLAMHSGLYIQGVAQACIAAGVDLIGKCRVLKMRGGGGTTTLVTERGEVRAREVVVATNGYSDGAVPYLKQRLIPARLYLSATEPVDPKLMERFFPDRQLADSKRSMGWIRPTPDGTRLMVGGRGGMMGNDPEVHARKLYQDMVAMVPELAGIKLTHCWYGVIAFPMDFLPHVSKVDGIHYIVGCCGVGMCAGTYLGNRIGNRILGAPQADSATAVDDLRFPRIPGPSAMNRLYSRLGIEWYNLRDWWDLRQK